MKASDDQMIIFTSANLVTMEQEVILKNYDLIIQGDRILDLAPAGKIFLPPNATVIDAKGKFLLPGLADMHVHLWEPEEMILFLTNGVTTVRNMWGAQRHLQWQKEIEKGELMSPFIFTTSPLTDGEPPMWDGSTVVTTQSEAVKAIHDAKEQGYSAIKVYNRLSKEAYLAIMEEAKKQNIPVVGHIPSAVGLQTALENHQYCIEHLEGYLKAIQTDDSPAMEIPLEKSYERMKAFLEHVDERKIDEIVQKTIEMGTWNCVTLVVYQKYVSQKHKEKLMQQAEMKYVSPQIKSEWNPSTDFRSKDLSEDFFDLIRQADKLRLKITKKLHKAGANLLLGTDTPNPFVIPGFSIHEELTNLIKAGLSPYEAIETGTKKAAEFMQLSNEFGTLSKGKRADLILVLDNPLENIANLRQIEGVMVRGTWINREQIDDMLQNLVQEYSKEPIWFEGMDKLESPHERTQTRTYEVEYNGFIYAQEQFSISYPKNTNQEQKFLHVQFMTSDGKIKNDTRFKIDKNGQLTNFHLKERSSSGIVNIQVNRTNAKYSLEGRLVDNSTVNREWDADETFVSNPYLGSIISFAHKFVDLEIGEETTIITLDINFVPNFGLLATTYTIQRLDLAESGEQIDNVLASKFFRLKKENQSSKNDLKLWLDVSHLPVRFELTHQFGTYNYSYKVS